MTNGIHILKGTVHGKTIALEQEAGFPDGQVVSVTMVPASPNGEGLRHSFGAWANEGSELDQFLNEIRHDRKRERAEPSR